MNYQKLPLDSINNLIRTHEGVFLLCFSATWCRPCEGLGETILRLEKRYSKKFASIVIDVDLNQDVVEHFKIKGVPACIFYKDGARIDSLSGSQPTFVFIDTIDELLNIKRVGNS